MVHLWNETNILKMSPGQFIFNPPNPIMIDMLGNKIKMDKISLEYMVEDLYYLGKIDLVNTTGIYNVKRQTFKTKSLTTKLITAKEIQTNWKNVSKETFDQSKPSFGLEVIGMVKET